MFAVIRCPICQHKATVPEGDMGKRQICPNCKSPFLAGKSVADEEAPMRFEPAGAVGVNKTMLGDTAPPIQYSCPRCKKALEAPAIEAGTKKPCPSCGQRLQVPASSAPAAAPPAPAINKTMLGETEPPIRYNCPVCKKPLESPAIEAGVKKPCPACGQRLQVPLSAPGGAPRPNPNKTILATDESRPQPAGSPAAYASTNYSAGQTAADAVPVYKRPYAIAGMVAVGLVLLVLLACLVTAPGASAEREKFAKVQKDFEDYKKDVEQKTAALEQARKLVESQTHMAERTRADFERQRLESERDLNAKLAQNASDQKAQQILKEHYAEERRRADDRERQAEEKRRQDAAKTQMELEVMKAQLKQANERPPVIQYAPPPYYRYHPYYGWGY